VPLNKLKRIKAGVRNCIVFYTELVDFYQSVTEKEIWQDLDMLFYQEF